MKKVILQSTENSEIALDELVAEGLAERRGKKNWRLTWEGQDKGIEIWERLTENEKMMLFGMLDSLDTIDK